MNVKFVDSGEFQVFGQFTGTYMKIIQLFIWKETPEQREGAFSNFRISPVTISKLQGEYGSDVFLFQCIIWKWLFQLIVVAAKKKNTE